MARTTIDSIALREMFNSGAALLTQNREAVDALNVFPVPDGDTGTNMSLTIGTAAALLVLALLLYLVLRKNKQDENRLTIPTAARRK